MVSRLTCRFRQFVTFCSTKISQIEYEYRFSRPFLSPLHSISSIFNSISSGEAYCVRILSSISSNCHSYSESFFVIQMLKKWSLQIRQLSLKFVSQSLPLSELGMLGSDSSFFFLLQTNSLFCHSNSSSVIWAFISGRRFLSDFLTKINANRRNRLNNYRYCPPMS